MFTIYKLVLSAPVPPPSGTPSVLARFGDHLRAARIRNGLTQIQLTEIPGVTKFTVWNREDCRNEPGPHQCARFIGYDPFPIGLSLAERMLAFRRRRGLRTKDAAKLAGVDPASWSSWEHKASAASAALRAKFEKRLRNELR